jgi:hypothetical protein
MQNGKSPGTDGLPVEFYKIFWKNIKEKFWVTFHFPQPTCFWSYYSPLCFLFEVCFQIILKLYENEKESCEGMISEEECAKAIKSMQNGKSLGTDGLPVEFYKIFWKNIKKFVSQYILSLSCSLYWVKI